MSRPLTCPSTRSPSTSPPTPPSTAGSGCGTARHCCGPGPTSTRRPSPSRCHRPDAAPPGGGSRHLLRRTGSHAARRLRRRARAAASSRRRSRDVPRDAAALGGAADRCPTSRRAARRSCARPTTRSGGERLGWCRWQGGESGGADAGGATRWWPANVLAGRAGSGRPSWCRCSAGRARPWRGWAWPGLPAATGPAVRFRRRGRPRTDSRVCSWMPCHVLPRLPPSPIAAFCVSSAPEASLSLSRRHRSVVCGLSRRGARAVFPCLPAHQPACSAGVGLG